jgi:hypothetical protein
MFVNTFHVWGALANSHYQFYDDYNVYEERCRKQDFKGYRMVFDESIDIIKDIDSSDEVTVEEILETEYLTKDTVRKYQLTDYNKSLCLSNMFPEMSAPDCNNSVIVAPGEGKVPKNILYDDDWDIKAFPHLNSPNGKYGLHHDREIKLNPQNYYRVIP